MSTSKKRKLNERLFFQLAIGGCTVFVIVFLAEGWLREGYSPLKFPVSSLSIGKWGWIQKLNFIVAGTTILSSSFGIGKIGRVSGMRSMATAVAFAGIGLIGAGFFNSDPIYGYPQNIKLALSQYTLTGHLHDFFSLLFFFGLPFALFNADKLFRLTGDSKKAGIFRAAVHLMILFFFLAGISFKHMLPFVQIAGLFQRLSIVTGLGCLIKLYLSFVRLSLKRELWHLQY